MPGDLTVGHLLRLLRDLDPNLPLRLAINPDWPFAHFVGSQVVVHDGTAYLADNGQEEYLPVVVRNTLNWS